MLAQVREAGLKLGVRPSARVRHFVGSIPTTHEAGMRRHIWVLRSRAIYGARCAGQDRVGFFLRHFAMDFPRRVLRRLLRTPSSQPLIAVEIANWKLLGLMPRLVSVQGDEEAWQTDLRKMNWPW